LFQSVKDINGESIVIDGGWIDKLDWGGNSKTRVPATQYESVDVKETSRRKKIVFGEKEELLQVLIRTGGPIVALMVRAEQRPQLDELIAKLERARAAAS
jgi:hypothetical protein